MRKFISQRVVTAGGHSAVAAASSFSVTSFRFCGSSKDGSSSKAAATAAELPIGSPTDTTMRDPTTAAAAARAMKAQEAMWSAKPEKVPVPKKRKSGGLQQTTLQESQEMEMERKAGSKQNSADADGTSSGDASSSTTTASTTATAAAAAEPEVVVDEQWCTVPTLYRRILKLILRKFGDHPDVAIRAWKQAKYEFWHFRTAPPEDVPMLVHRGKMIHKAVMGGVVPVVHNPKTGLSYCKYDKETLEAAGGVIDPISAEEFLRRNYEKMDKDELHELRDKLKVAGRWKGPDEFRKEDVPKLKTKRKAKCTDPDPVEEEEEETKAGEASATSTRKA